MCEPVTMTGLMYVAAGAAVAGAGVAAYGAYEQGQAGKKAGDYQAAVARNNSIIANQNADAAGRAGYAQAEAASMRTAQAVGRSKAIAGASGVNVDAGSPLAVQGDVARLGMLDALTIKSNAGRAAYGYKVQGMSYDAQGTLDQMMGKNSERAGELGATSSIIGGASSVSDKWLYYQRLSPNSGGGSSININSSPSNQM